MKITTGKRIVLQVTAALSLLLGLAAAPGGRAHADNSRNFPETGHTVSGKFLDYWNNNGGLAQQGYPISEEMQEQSDTDGKTYTMQYFERAVFELHPENAAPYDVLLSLLGTAAYGDKYKDNAPGQTPSTTNPRKFPQTGKTIGGVFRTYWEEHGGLAQQGYPISDEFHEQSATDGKTYTVQYFERAVFEYHPENAAPNNVLLSLLGTFAYNAKHGSGGTHTPPVTPPSAATLAQPGWTTVAATINNIALFYNAADGSGASAKINADGSLTPLQRFPDAATGNGSFSSGWTNIVAGPSNFLLFYMANSGGAAVLSYGEDGIGHQLNSFNIGAGWSNISIDPRTGVALLYNGTTEDIEVARINPDGSFTEIRDQKATDPKPTDYRWTQFVPLGNGLWFWYVPDNGNGIIVSINGDGTFNTLQSYGTFDRNITHIVYAGATQAADKGKLYFYSQTAGTAAMMLVKYGDGSMAPGTTYTGLSTGWTNFTNTLDGVVLVYDKTGHIATDSVDDSGKAVPLKRYNAPSK